MRQKTVAILILLLVGLSAIAVADRLNIDNCYNGNLQLWPNICFDANKEKSIDAKKDYMASKIIGRYFYIDNVQIYNNNLNYSCYFPSEPNEKKYTLLCPLSKMNCITDIYVRIANIFPSYFDFNLTNNNNYFTVLNRSVVTVITDHITKEAEVTTKGQYQKRTGCQTGPPKDSPCAIVYRRTYNAANITVINGKSRESEKFSNTGIYVHYGKEFIINDGQYTYATFTVSVKENVTYYGWRSYYTCPTSPDESSKHKYICDKVKTQDNNYNSLTIQDIFVERLPKQEVRDNMPIQITAYYDPIIDKTIAVLNTTHRKFTMNIDEYTIEKRFYEIKATSRVSPYDTIFLKLVPENYYYVDTRLAYKNNTGDYIELSIPEKEITSCKVTIYLPFYNYTVPCTIFTKKTPKLNISIVKRDENKILLEVTSIEPVNNVEIEYANQTKTIDLTSKKETAEFEAVEGVNFAKASSEETPELARSESTIGVTKNSNSNIISQILYIIMCIILLGLVIATGFKLITNGAKRKWD